jgi:biopolymer transport protein ExbB/TolQ
MFSAFGEFFIKGGLEFMVPISLIAVAVLVVAIERFYFLFVRFNINAETFMAQIYKQVMANNIDRAIKLCNAAGKAMLPRVIKAGLTRANKSDMEIANAIEESILEVLPDLQKRTDSLNLLGQVATYMGLLGTIFGMIGAFKAVGSAKAEEKAALLANNISVAMNTTAFGLMVAIPSTLFYLFLSGMSKKILADIDQYSVKLENLLTSRSKGAAVEKQQV